MAKGSIGNYLLPCAERGKKVNYFLGCASDSMSGSGGRGSHFQHLECRGRAVVINVLLARAHTHTHTHTHTHDAGAHFGNKSNHEGSAQV